MLVGVGAALLSLVLVLLLLALLALADRLRESLVVVGMVAVELGGREMVRRQLCHLNGTSARI